VAASTVTSTRASSLREHVTRRWMWRGGTMRRPMQSGIAKRRMQREPRWGGERCCCRKEEGVAGDGVREKRLRSWGLGCHGF
jgi:hypothetical protein